MTKPTILVTTGILYQEGKTPVCQCRSTYVNALADAGAYSLILPPIPDMDSIRRIINNVDGLLLTGGGDINPDLYGEFSDPSCKNCNRDRDITEITAVQIAIEIGLPVFGICRGQQILNVALGGTLIQDIPSQVPDSITHREEGNRNPLHSVKTMYNTMLQDIEGKSSFMVNSIHHQSVKKLGDGLVISAISDDGVVEAIESAEGKHVLSVQWHPEESTNDYPQFRKLFEWFVSLAASI